MAFLQKIKIIVVGKENGLAVITAVINVVNTALKNFHDRFLSESVRRPSGVRH